ncbi:MAG TPA: anthranilate synthase component I [Symbiobacteriaceae bacterium]|nr:anthranilate synthase component I [Symbiobacteriaceae bacterium]
MYQPSLGTYRSLAKEYSLIPVYREVLADLETPISVFMKLCQEEPGAFLLESVEGGEKVARYSFLGCRPLLTLAHRHGESRAMEGEAAAEYRTVGQMTHGTEGGRTFRGDPLTHLRDVMDSFRAHQPAGLPRFFGGAVGYLSYDAVRAFEKLPGTPRDDQGLPDALFMITELVVVFDHLKHKLLLIANTRPGAEPEVSYRRAVALLDRAAERLRSPVPVPPGVSLVRPRPLEVTSNLTREEFESAVLAAKEYIKAGDIFQVVLSQRLQTSVRARPLDIYRVLRTINPSPYMFYITFGDLKIIGSSPEMLVRVEDGIAQTRPIAGTRPRGSTEAEDLAFEQELLADEKERAEHIMLVDLGRNDLGRACQYGTVEVRNMMHVERYSHVMHIVSDVQGQVAEGRDAFDVLRACFPAGTLSGAPKVRAMEIIDEMEPVRRSVYGGAVGYFAWGGAMDTCIAIRTMVMKGDKVTIQAGAGIVADSDPAAEYQESLNKARAVIRALETAEEGLL